MDALKMLVVPLAVAPFTGAWIEIDIASKEDLMTTVSHPSRVRGLKLQQGNI